MPITITGSADPEVRRQNYAEALAYANRLIEENGGTPQDDLHPGRLSLGLSCPLTRTIEAGLPTANTIQVGYNGVAILMSGMEAWDPEPLPLEVAQFVADFDAGRYPGLIAEEVN